MEDDFDPRDLMGDGLPLLSDLKLIEEGDPSLSMRIPSFDFDGDDRDPTKIAELLIAAMDHFGGVGLAANQVGINIRAFAMLYYGRAGVFFNPVLTELSPDTVMMSEGCLTFNNIVLKIARPTSCRLVFTGANGVRKSIVLSGLEARIAQHEIDHLNGIVMANKVTKTKLDMAKKKALKRLT